MRYFRYIIWSIIIILGIAFTCINARTVEVDYYFGKSITVFLPLLILLGLIVGVALGYLTALPKIIRTQHQVRQLKRELNKVNEGGHDH